MPYANVSEIMKYVWHGLEADSIAYTFGQLGGLVKFTFSES